MALSGAVDMGGLTLTPSEAHVSLDTCEQDAVAWLYSTGENGRRDLKTDTSMYMIPKASSQLHSFQSRTQLSFE